MNQTFFPVFFSSALSAFNFAPSGRLPDSGSKQGPDRNDGKDNQTTPIPAGLFLWSTAAGLFGAARHETRRECIRSKDAGSFAACIRQTKRHHNKQGHGIQS
jgi:hypothetical protein